MSQACTHLMVTSLDQVFAGIGEKSDGAWVLQDDEDPHFDLEDLVQMWNHITASTATEKHEKPFLLVDDTCYAVTLCKG